MLLNAHGATNVYVGRCYVLLWIVQMMYCSNSLDQSCTLTYYLLATVQIWVFAPISYIRHLHYFVYLGAQKMEHIISCRLMNFTIASHNALAKLSYFRYIMQTHLSRAETEHCDESVTRCVIRLTTNTVSVRHVMKTKMTGHRNIYWTFV